MAGLALAVGWSVPATAQGAFAGAWQVARADAAPWVDAAPAPDAELRGLIGKTVVIQKSRIDGPRPLRCPKANYQIKDYTADMLFQGGLTKEPEKQAAALGFKGSPIKTLETGCANELDFHMAEADRVLFALNNRVYTLTRKRR